MISEIAGNGIYDSSLRRNDSFCELFKFENDQIKAKSSIFCQSFIKNYFDPTYTMNFLLEIAGTFNNKQSSSNDYKEIFRSSLRFSFIERLLPDENKKANLDTYYERLKKKVPWLIQDPHFWMQYAMAKIAAPDFEKAQQFLDNAYGKAKKKHGYDTSSIETQQARLYFLKAIKEESTMLSVQLFSCAHKLLCITPNDMYKFRQLHLYIEYYNTRFNFLDKQNKNKFIYSCKEILNIVKNDISQKLYQNSGVLAEIETIVSSEENNIR